MYVGKANKLSVQISPAILTEMGLWTDLKKSGIHKLISINARLNVYLLILLFHASSVQNHFFFKIQQSAESIRLGNG